MKKFYFRFQTMLLTFAFGLAGVNLFQHMAISTDEIKMELPVVQTNSMIFVVPVEEKQTFSRKAADPIRIMNACPGDKRQEMGKQKNVKRKVEK